MSTVFKKLIATFYKASSGKEPVRIWLLELSADNRKRIGTDIKTVEFGWPIGMPVCKPSGNGLYEVRTNLTNSEISRVIFCIRGNLMILLHGFLKKTQKTPIKDIDLATKRMKEILNGHH